MIYFTLILGILLSICNYLLGYTFGKFKGAKDGIDYCFKQRMREQLSKEHSEEKEAMCKNDKMFLK